MLPRSALLACLLLPTAPALAQDHDGDGVPSAVDAYPCDASAAAAAFAPAEGAHGMLLFEDQWPSAGDLDFNDAVVTYNYAYRLDGAGRVTALRLTLNALAIGGRLHNGLGLHLPVPRSSVASVTRRLAGQSAPTTLAPSSADAQLTVVVAADLRELFDGAELQINSEVELPARTGRAAEVLITFASPVVLPVSGAPYDLFLFRSDDPTHEIHRPEFAGTAAMNTARFGTGDDGSTTGRWFVDFDGLPFVLVLPAPTVYPREAVEITALFPAIATFAASGGTSARDFYVAPVVQSNAYARAGAPSPAFVGAAATPADTSCVPAVGLPSNPAMSCVQAGGTGTYWLDPNGGSTADAFQGYCDNTRDGGGWLKVESAAWPFLFGTDNWQSLADGTPTAANYSILGRRAALVDSSGCYTFRFRVGDTGVWTDGASHTTVWRQCHDPFTQSTNGSDYTYLSGEASTTCGGFNGLHNAYVGYSFTSDPDSTDNYGCWWQQVVPNRNYNSLGYLEGFGGVNHYHQWQTLWIRSNARPVVDTFNLSSPSAQAGVPITITALAHDPEGATVTYAWSSDNAAWSISANAGPSIVVTPPAGAGTSMTLRLTVSDGIETTVYTHAFCAPVAGPVGRSCQALLQAGVTTSGTYALDVDGSGSQCPFTAYCDMTTDGGGWTKLESAAWPFLFGDANWQSLNGGDPTQANYSMLSRRTAFADAGGCYTLRFRVGDSGLWTGAPAHTTVWRQCHDPFTQSTTGGDYTFIAGEVPTTCGGFNGLHSRYQGYSYTSDPDASDNINCWWMQVVPNRNYNGSGYLEGYGGSNHYHQWQSLWVR